ncbi:MAG: Winged helix DNA-binding domain [Pseudomonadota bacterium]
MFQPGAIRDPDRHGTDRPAGRAAPVRLIKAICLAQDRAPGLTLTQFLVFMTVADEEGIRLNDLGIRIGESQAVISRNVRALTSAVEPGSLQPAHGLLTLMRDREDGRGRRAALSPLGRNLIVQIEHILEA